MVKLFLDDVRMPDELVSDIYNEGGWHVARDYQEFVNFVVTQGVPDLVSFDHDLADEHYDIDWWEVYMGGVLPDTSHKTGYECAVWLQQFCEDSDSALPTGLCHSMNPTGRMMIEEYVKKWR